MIDLIYNDQKQQQQQGKKTTHIFVNDIISVNKCPLKNVYHCIILKKY